MGVNGYICRTQDGTIGYFLRDGHGDIQTVYAEDRTTKLADYTYDAWGNQNNAESLSWGESNPIRYAGQYYDTESGMFYLRARYYNPDIGRFINEDPAKDGLNWFAYCGNNPIDFVDMLGLYKISLRDLYNHFVKFYGGDNYNFWGNTLTVYNDNKNADIFFWAGSNSVYRKSATFNLDIPSTGVYKDRAVIEPRSFLDALKLDYTYYKQEITITKVDKKIQKGMESLVIGGITYEFHPVAGITVSTLYAIFGSEIGFSEGTYELNSYVLAENDTNNPLHGVVIWQVRKQEKIDGQNVWVDYKTILR